MTKDNDYAGDSYKKKGKKERRKYRLLGNKKKKKERKKKGGGGEKKKKEPNRNAREFRENVFVIIIPRLRPVTEKRE